MLFTLEKMVVAADDAADSTTANAIATLRSQLAGGGETMVDQDGTVYNPDDPMTNPSSMKKGSGYKTVDKAVVAADSSTADAIAALRNQLAGGGETMVNQDGTVLNPADPLSASSLANGDGFKPVDKAVVAADSSTADAIAALRNQLAGGGETMVNQDGTVLNPADPLSASSLANGDGFKPVDKAVVAVSEADAEERARLREQLEQCEPMRFDENGSQVLPESPSSLQSGRGFRPIPKTIVEAPQWYQTNPQLQRLEIKAMADIHPDAKMDYLPNGKMCWTVRLRPVVCGKRKDWTLLAVYDSDHPQQRWGGSVKFYPVQPNYEEMVQMVQKSCVTPKDIPHLLRDDDNQIYMCTQDKGKIFAGHRKGEKVTTAAACLRFAMRWITVFELGLIDQKTWSLFQQHGKI